MHRPACRDPPPCTHVPGAQHTPGRPCAITWFAVQDRATAATTTQQHLTSSVATASPPCTADSAPPATLRCSILVPLDSDSSPEVRGRALSVVGELEGLGEWDPNEGLPMRWREGQGWLADMEVPLEALMQVGPPCMRMHATKAAPGLPLACDLIKMGDGVGTLGIGPCTPLRILAGVAQESGCHACTHHA